MLVNKGEGRDVLVVGENRGYTLVITPMDPDALTVRLTIVSHTTGKTTTVVTTDLVMELQRRALTLAQSL